MDGRQNGVRESAQKILFKVHDFARENYIMILSDECEKVLRRLFEEHSPSKVLEIGTAIGYSSSLMALLSDCTIDTIDKDGERIASAKKLWSKLGVEDRITAYEGDADDILADVVDGKIYDFVFLDGAKSAYRRQLEFLLPHIKDGGVVLCDDVLYLGLVRGEENVPHKHRTIVRNMREFLRFVENVTLFESKVYDEGNGIAVAIKKPSEKR